MTLEEQLVESMVDQANGEAEGLAAIATAVAGGVYLGPRHNEYGPCDALAWAVRRSWPRAVEALVAAGSPLHADPMFPAGTEEDSIPFAPFHPLPMALWVLAQMLGRDASPEEKLTEAQHVALALVRLGADPSVPDPFLFKNSLQVWIEEIQEWAQHDAPESGFAQDLILETTERVLDAWPDARMHGWRSALAQGRGAEWNLKELVEWPSLGAALVARCRADFLSDELPSPASSTPRVMRSRF